jgi:hypothetical protein
MYTESVLVGENAALNLVPPIAYRADFHSD